MMGGRVSRDSRDIRDSRDERDPPSLKLRRTIRQVPEVSFVPEDSLAGRRDSHDSQVPEVLVVPVVPSVSDVPLVVNKGGKK